MACQNGQGTRHKFFDQRQGCHFCVDSVNDATRSVTTFAVPRLGVFLFCFQHSVPGISHNVPYWLLLRNTNSKHGWTFRLLTRIQFHFWECWRNGDIRITKKSCELSIIWYLCRVGKVPGKCVNILSNLLAELYYVTGVLLVRNLNRCCAG